MAAISPLRQRMIEDDGPQSARRRSDPTSPRWRSAAGKLDDPSFPAPIYASLIEAEDGAQQPDLVPLNRTGGHKPPSPLQRAARSPSRRSRTPPLANKGRAAGPLDFSRPALHAGRSDQNRPSVAQRALRCSDGAPRRFERWLSGSDQVRAIRGWRKPALR